MAMTPLAATRLSWTDPNSGMTVDKEFDAPDLRLVVFALIFIFGGITSLNSVIIPKLNDLPILTIG